MAVSEQVALLKRDPRAWNQWRADDPLTVPDLQGADLEWANLVRVNLSKARLAGARLHGANLFKADLDRADLQGATLTAACLEFATLVETDLRGASLAGSDVFGASVWAVRVSEATCQTGLRITPEGEPAITVDDLEVAQFVYLLLRNEKARNAIDTVGRKVVLILGRFSAERMLVLDAVRDRLRALDFVPMVFDFERPAARDCTETIRTLAGLSRFIVADITDPRSVPLELQAIVPDHMVPLVPIIQESDRPFAMFGDLRRKYGAWVLDPLVYDSVATLVAALEGAVVQPALARERELQARKAEQLLARHARDYAAAPPASPGSATPKGARP